MKFAGVLIALAILGSPVNAGDRLDVRVSPTAALAPAEILIQTTVERDTNNYAMEIVAESEDFYRASTVQLNGVEAPRVATTCFSNLPAGLFEVRVSVLAKDGRVLATTKRLLVVS